MGYCFNISDWSGGSLCFIFSLVAFNLITYLPGLELAAFSLSSGGRGEPSLVSLLIRTLIQWDHDPSFMTSFNLNYPLKALFPYKVTFGFRNSTWILEGLIQSITDKEKGKKRETGGTLMLFP